MEIARTLDREEGDDLFQSLAAVVKDGQYSSSSNTASLRQTTAPSHPPSNSDLQTDGAQESMAKLRQASLPSTMPSTTSLETAAQAKAAACFFFHRNQVCDLEHIPIHTLLDTHARVPRGKMAFCSVKIEPKQTCVSKSLETSNDANHGTLVEPVGGIGNHLERTPLSMSKPDKYVYEQEGFTQLLSTCRLREVSASPRDAAVPELPSVESPASRRDNPWMD
ncbi:hypothetical protein CI238_00391 [Colletotrichum incanum]|uniref:Uncharacterized protein n=1 Tax=Colletotrichum incanum TaxID=1573173 RepID=A0A167BHC9_COLIC|nr:hypothetical protein CI238_00391 [Colletotrichum incanum]